MVNKYYQKTKKSFGEKHVKSQNLSEEVKEKDEKRPETYKNLSEEEKQEKCQYHCDQNKNLSEEQKRKKTGYMRNYYLAHKK